MKKTYILLAAGEGAQFTMVFPYISGDIQTLTSFIKRNYDITGKKFNKLFFLVKQTKVNENKCESPVKFFSQCLKHGIFNNCRFNHPPFESFIDLRAPMRNWGPLTKIYE